jgi:hypothetical protein
MGRSELNNISCCINSHDPVQLLFNKYCMTIRNSYCNELSKFLGITQGTQLYNECTYNFNSSFDGGTLSDGRIVKPIAPKIANIAIKKGIYAPDMIQAVFETWTHNKPPFPNYFLGTVCWDNAENYRKNYIYRLANRVHSFITRVSVQLHAYNKASSIGRVDISSDYILSKSLQEAGNSSALVSVCIANQLGVQKILWSLFDQAMIEYLAYREAWDEILINFLPDDFREIADKQVNNSLLQLSEQNE